MEKIKQQQIELTKKYETTIKDYVLSRIDRIDSDSFSIIENKIDEYFVKGINSQHKKYFEILYNSFSDLGIFNDFKNQHLNPIGEKLIVSEKVKTDILNEVIDLLYSVKIGNNWESMRDYSIEKLRLMISKLEMKHSIEKNIKKHCKNEIVFKYEEDVNSILKK